MSEVGMTVFKFMEWTFWGGVSRSSPDTGVFTKRFHVPLEIQQVLEFEPYIISSFKEFDVEDCLPLLCSEAATEPYPASMLPHMLKHKSTEDQISTRLTATTAKSHRILTI
jgi:hypothetical protein